MQRFVKTAFALLLISAVALAPAIAFAASPETLARMRVAAAGIQQGAAQASASVLDRSQAEDADRNDGYELVDIKIPGAVYVWPFEVNNRRIVSGIYPDSSGKIHTFLWFNGQVMTIDKAGELITAVGAINDNGLLFGNWGTDTEQHAGYYDLETATWTQLPDLPGYPLNIGDRMNKVGQAVGYACRGGTFEVSLNCDGWTWDGSQYTIYTYPGAVNTFPLSINNKGEEVGQAQTPATYAGYTRFEGLIQDLILTTHSGLFHPLPNDINDSGAILASASLVPNSFPVSFIMRSSKKISRLPDYPAVFGTFYYGMNEHEDLAGVWFTDQTAFPYHGFVALHKQKKDD